MRHRSLQQQKNNNEWVSESSQLGTEEPLQLQTKTKPKTSV
jgi:hypothetical protein